MADDDENDAIIPAGFTARMLQRSPAGDQLDNEKTSAITSKRWM